MAIKLYDIVKDSRALTITGFALVAIWVLLLPTYISHAKATLAAQDLAAYLLIKEVIAGSSDRIEMATPGGEVVPGPGTLYKFNWPTPEDAIKVCDAPWGSEPGGPHPAKQHSSNCGHLTVALPERDLPSHDLIFRAVDTRRDGDIFAYFKLAKPIASYPFERYGLVLAKREGAIIPGCIDPAIDIAGPTDQARRTAQAGTNARQNLWSSYGIYIVRVDEAESFLAPVGDETAFLDDSLGRVIYGKNQEYRYAHLPRHWLLIKEHLRLLGLPNPDIDKLTYTDPAVELLINRYLRVEETFDVGGLKAPIQLSTWVIAALLVMISFLLYGSVASLRLATVDDMVDDFGWLLLQTRRSHGALSGIFACAILAAAAAILLWAVAITIAAMDAIENANSLALTILVGAIAFFAVVSGAFLFQQIRLAWLRAGSVGARVSAEEESNRDW